LCFAPNIIKVTIVKEDEMDRERGKQEETKCCKVFPRKPEGGHLEDQGIDGN
jgi:hypothetical protein